MSFSFGIVVISEMFNFKLNYLSNRVKLNVVQCTEVKTYICIVMLFRY